MIKSNKTIIKKDASFYKFFRENTIQGRKPVRATRSQ